MIAHNDDILEQTGETMYNLNQDEAVRYWCEAREDGLRIMHTIQNQHKAELAEKDFIIKQKDSALAQKESALAQKDSALAQKDYIIEQLQAEILRLQVSSDKKAD